MSAAIANTCGVILAIFGTEMLWRSSPSGYAAPFYGNAEILNTLASTDRSMTRRQWSAIGLMTLGAILQIAASWLPSL